ncbi:MAG: DUF4215 domain-containing protein [Kofleriaceae bacterium]
MAVCGDGIVRPGFEQCDDGNAVETDACLSSCILATCGDGIVHAGVEVCDDGNQSNSDACRTNCVAAACGDGFVYEGFERCDDGDASNSNACLTTCEPAACGDGFVWGGVEACDDGNSSNTDKCLNTCVAPRCGDGFIQEGVEQCDSGAVMDPNCRACIAECGGPGQPPCYVVLHAPYEWAEAVTQCVDAGMTLATITSAAEYAIVDALLGALRPGDKVEGWIGLNDRVDEGVERWVSGSNSTYRKWGVGGSGNNAGFDCVAHVATDGWHFAECRKPLPVVCEGPRL